MTRVRGASGRETSPVQSAFLVLALLQGCFAFNLDTEHFTRHVSPGGRSGMFGFTVAAHRERGQSWVMVGAPEAQTRQAGVIKGGAVYRCEISRDNACAEVAFDTTGNKNDSYGIQIESKSHQWFGATLNSAGEDKPIVACAPRYTVFAPKRRDPVGTCYIARDSFNDVSEYAPCRTRDWGYHRQGSCQAGLGAALSKDGQRLFIGAPGSWYWQGQLYSHGSGNRQEPVFKTPESSALDDDSYLGYSVAVGDFSGNGEQGVAVGMPRGSLLNGTVILYTWDLRSHQNLSGEQLGAYFGYCMCASDVDGDGLDDLVVGAPMYTVSNNEGKYDVGRIYVIYQMSEMGRYQLVHYRDGVMSRSRFGLSLAGLGDINMDGYGDFAVGAPYDGVFGRGAVYIYHGGQNGVREKPSQIIRAEEVYSGPLSTFGFSVGGGLDLDSNQYTDLVVGAYESDAAFLFRAKPVIQMNARIEFGSKAKLISLDERNCQLYNKQRVACTNITYCLEYKGIGVDTAVEFDLEFILDTKKPNDPRLFFLDNEGRFKRTMRIPLVREELTCNILQVYIVDRVRDKLTPIEAEMKYSMKNQQQSSVVVTRNPRSVLQPILDQNVANSQKDAINILKNCGPSNVCIPDLQIIATPSVSQYLLGSKERFNVDVVVQNKGDDAFEATYALHVPPGINYIKIERIDNAVAEIPVQCSPPTNYNNNTLKCDIGNPLPKGRLVHFKVLLEPYHKTGMAPSYDFYMEANSTNPENNKYTDDNKQFMSVNIWLKTDLAITGTSIPPELHYNTSHYQAVNMTHEADIGPQLVHLYGIRNNGPSTIEEAEIFLVWPYETLAGDSLMYVLDQPETMGNVKCERAEHVNDFNLFIDRKKSYLDSSNAALHGAGFGGGSMSGGNYGSSVSGGGSASGGITSGGTSGSTVSGGGSVSGGITSGGSSGSTVSGGGYTTFKNSSWTIHSGTAGGKKTWTEEEKKKIEEEEKKFTNQHGDGSHIHQERAKNASGQFNWDIQGGQTAGGGQGSNNMGGYSYNKTFITSVGGGSQDGSQTWGGGQGGHQTWNNGQGTQWSGSQNWSSQQTGGSSGSKVVWVSGGNQGVQTESGGGNYVGGGGQTVSGGHYVGSGGQAVSGGQFVGGSGQTVSGGHYGENGGQTVSGGHYVGGGGQAVSGGQYVGSGGQYVGSGGQTVSGGQYVGSGGQTVSGGQYVGSGGQTVSGGQYVGSGGQTVSGGQYVGSGGQTVSGGQYVGSGGQAVSGGQYVGSGGQMVSGGHYVGGGGQSVSGGHYVGGAGQSSGGNYWNQQYWPNGTPITGSYNKTSVSSWNSTMTGSGPAVIHHTNKNMTFKTGPDGQVIHTESSTEYDTVGSNAEADRIFNYNRINGGGSSYSGTAGSSYGSNAGTSGTTYYAVDGQGGSTSYGTRYTAGSRRVDGGNGNLAGDSGAQRWSGGGDSYSGSGSRHKWSTEETVNEDLINLGSKSVAGSTFVGAQQPNLMGAAAAGQGFRVNTWDIGSVDQGTNTIGGGNVKTGGRKYETQGSSSYQKQWGSEVTEQARDNVATDKPSERFRWDRRTRERRQAPPPVEQQFYNENMQMDHNDKQLADAMRCPGLKCAVVRCVAGPLAFNHEIWLTLRSRVNAQTLKKLSFGRSVTLTSVAVARVSRLPYLGVPKDRPPHAQQAVSVLTPLAQPQPDDGVPLWVVVLSACAGTLLLLLLILALYKCGFFKRNRHSDAPERQPLNRNGYGHGDEQL